MKLVVITAEKLFHGEVRAIERLFSLGLEVLHLRKPGASCEQLRELILGIDEKYRDRIVLHDHFTLAGEFGLRGVHLNSRNPHPPQGFEGHVSRSCHSIEEIAALEHDGLSYDYVFLSPVFDSISKKGYVRAFSDEQLESAREAGLINERVFALGGINENNIAEVRRLGFGGVAILGILWEDFLKNYDENLLSDTLSRIRSATLRS